MQTFLELLSNNEDIEFRLPLVEHLIPLELKISDHSLEKDFDLFSNSLAFQLIRYARDIIPQTEVEQDNFNIEKIQSIIEENQDNRQFLESLVYRFYEKLFVSGNIKPKKINPATVKLLKEIGFELIAIREDVQEKGIATSIDKLHSLRQLDNKLLEFANEQNSIKPLKTDSITRADFVALNEQHIVIAQEIRKAENAFLKTIPNQVLTELSQKATFDKDVFLKQFPEFKQTITDLTKGEIIQENYVDGGRTLLSFAHGDLDRRTFEQLVPSRLREKLGVALQKEFQLRYSKKIRPLGISDTRSEGIPSLLDRLRVKRIAKDSGVRASLVVLALRYLEDSGLVQRFEEGYLPTPIATDFGLGIRGVREAAKRLSLINPDPSISSFDRYIAALELNRKRFEVPSYNLQTQDGSLPPTILLNELRFGSGFLNEKVLQGVLQSIHETPDSFVLLANSLQGDSAAAPRLQRSSVHPIQKGCTDYRDLSEQISLLYEFISKTIARPCINLIGRAEIDSAKIQADIQMVRDKQVERGNPRFDEETIDEALSRLNNQGIHTARMKNAKIHEEDLEFIVKVMFPLSMKLGRMWFSEKEVNEVIEINMNEFEIVRDMSSILIQNGINAVEQSKNEIKIIYDSFLNEMVDCDNYLNKLLQVIFPISEEIDTETVIARDGAKLNIIDTDGDTKLKVLLKSQAKFGRGEPNNPNDYTNGVIKSLGLAGEETYDVIFTGGSGQAFVQITEPTKSNPIGTLLVSSGTLQELPEDMSLLFDVEPSPERRRNYSRRRVNGASAVAVSGGIHNGKKTGCYTVKVWNEKIEKTLIENRNKGLQEKDVGIYFTSDWQTGSPTADAKSWFDGLVWAIASGYKEIVINGDVLQGQNYGRQQAEVGAIPSIEDQQKFVGLLLNEILEIIRINKANNPDFVLPRFTINVGNHETNSQSHKGGQGIWFLDPLYQQIKNFYSGLCGRDEAEKLVSYPRMFIDREGTSVDYSTSILDFRDSTGFVVGSQHYTGAMAKGSKLTTPIDGNEKWTHSLGATLEDFHVFVFAHFHTLSITNANGLITAIFGANAGQSGFEYHLGYADTVKANGVVHLNSKTGISLTNITNLYVEEQKELLSSNVAYLQLIQTYGSIENFIHFQRSIAVTRQDGNPSDFRKLTG